MLLYICILIHVYWYTCVALYIHAWSAIIFVCERYSYYLYREIFILSNNIYIENDTAPTVSFRRALKT
jgi:hypothetical protein